MKELTKKQKGFCKDYIDTGNKTKSALKNYNTEDYSTAASIGSENLKKPEIIEYLKSISSDATSRIEELSKTAKNETVRLNANKDILDRAGYKPVERKDLTTNGKDLPTPILTLEEDAISTNNRSKEDTEVKEEN